MFEDFFKEIVYFHGDRSHQNDHQFTLKRLGKREISLKRETL